MVREKMVCKLAMWTQKLYEFLDYNPVSTNNNAIEIDLFTQVANSTSSWDL
jgi:hypothetical protein